MIGRRTFLAGTGAVLLASPIAAEAQQTGKVYRVGMLLQRTPMTAEERAASTFRNTLRELGWFEGQNIAFVERTSVTVEPLDRLAAELVHLKVDVIFASGTPATLAARQATSTIPIVMQVGVDPVAQGLVASLQRPGGNITGVTQMYSEIHEKRLELMKQVIPGVRRVAYLWNRTNPGNASSVPSVEQNRKFEQTMGLTLQSHPVQAPEEFDSAFEKMKKERTDVVEVFSDPMLISYRRRLAELAMKHRLPSLFASRDHAEAGGLMAYSSLQSDLWRRVAFLVNKILKGAKPADIPVEQPTKFELVINLKTAKALGLTIPPSLLGRADEVIQ